MEQATIAVRADWDPEARVWIATSDDVPGLVTEAEGIDELIKKLPGIVLDLFEANGLDHPESSGLAPIDLVARLPQEDTRAA